MNESQMYIETALPIPQYDEVQPLNTFVQSGLPDNIERHEQLAEKVKCLNPLISEVIRHDIAFFEKYEIPESYTYEQSYEYIEGISIGYDFAIGVITYLFYLRSKANNIDDYLLTAQSSIGHIPVQTTQQLERVKKVRMDDESIIVASPCQDMVNASNNELQNHSLLSGDLARKDSGDYLYYAREIDDLLEYLIKDWIYNLNYEEGDDVQPFTNGVYHGFNNAVEMYLQSKEEDFVQNHEIKKN